MLDCAGAVRFINDNAFQEPKHNLRLWSTDTTHVEVVQNILIFGTQEEFVTHFTTASYTNFS